MTQPNETPQNDVSWDEVANAAPEPVVVPRARIQVGRDLNEMVTDAVAALVQYNENETGPKVFRYVDVLARVSRVEEPDGLFRARIKQYDRATLTGELARAAEWFSWSERQHAPRPAVPHPHVVGEILGSADLYTDIPALDQIVGCPIFSADGCLQTTSGYSAATRTWYDAMDTIEIPEVPSTPDVDDVVKAKRLLVDDLLGDFPFDSDADRAHAIGLAVTLVARRLFRGQVPLHGFDAPTEGTGKTLLVESLLTLVSGIQPSLSSAPASRDDAEWDKRITAALLNGRQYMVWDNVNDTLQSASLAKLLTSSTYGSRLLGLNKDLELPVRLITIYTGNNVGLTREMARRTVRCRLNTHTEIPSQGRSFKHDPLLPWVIENRGRLLWSLYVLVRNWLSRGRQPFLGNVLGSYEEWSRVVGGVLDAAEIPGFLTNREAVYESVEEGSSELSFFEAWWSQYMDSPVESDGLCKLAQEHLGMSDKLGLRPPSAQQVGMRLNKLIDRVSGPFEVKLMKARPRTWALRKNEK